MLGKCLVVFIQLISILFLYRIFFCRFLSSFQKELLIILLFLLAKISNLYKNGIILIYFSCFFRSVVLHTHAQSHLVGFLHSRMAFYLALLIHALAVDDAFLHRAFEALRKSSETL